MIPVTVIVNVVPEGIEAPATKLMERLLVLVLTLADVEVIEPELRLTVQEAVATISFGKLKTSTGVEPNG